MDLQLRGKRALVSGSSIGIGEVIARTLAEEGVAVAIHGCDPDRAQAVAATIMNQGGAAVVMTGDLTDDSAVMRIVAESERLLGGVYNSVACITSSAMLAGRARSMSRSIRRPRRESAVSTATLWRRSG